MPTSRDPAGRSRLASLLPAAVVLAALGGTVATVVVGQTARPSRMAAGPVSDAPDARSFVEDGIVKVYFASGGAVLPSDARGVLKDVVKEVGLGQRAVIVPYAVTGDASRDLATRRVAQLRDALKGLGLPPDKIEVRAPVPSPEPPDPGAARRVDVMVVD